MRLYLFDIDGTLVTTGGAGRRALERAFRDVLGWAGALDHVAFGGMTDRLLVRAAFAGRGLDAGAARAAEPDLLAAYAAALADELARAAAGCRALPGVTALLDALAPRDDVLPALLTGNVAPGARLKLAACGLAGRFDVGAWGDDADDRPGLLPVACARAAARAGRPFAGPDAVVIGDTPADVAVARAHGARAVAVATGAASRADLAACRPDALLDDLADLERALAALAGP